MRNELKVKEILLSYQIVLVLESPLVTCKATE